MSNYRINFEQIDPDVTIDGSLPEKLARAVLSGERVSEAAINIILVDDQYITRLNHQFLNKNTTTDVISFNLEDEPGGALEGEVYANIEQIRRQAEDYQVTFKEELCRVLIHGILHLVGFEDYTSEQRLKMVAKEDYYLNILKNNI